MAEEGHTLVTAINRVFYDIEAESYDERHMEVVVGDLEWWEQAGARYFHKQSNSPIVILDIGCGTGFVGHSVMDHLSKGDLFIGFDLSSRMLEQAKKKMDNKPPVRPEFVHGEAHHLPFRDTSIDVLTMNAILHHLGDYAAVLAEADRVLKSNGYILINHEPNRTFFRSPAMRLLASFYKLIGCGIDLNNELEAEVNRELKKQGMSDRKLKKNEIQRLVEFHSPVEQSRIGVNQEKGFDPGEIASEYFPGYKVVELEEFTTFFVRPIFEQFPWLGRTIRTAWKLFSRRGNLFRLALQKA